MGQHVRLLILGSLLAGALFLKPAAARADFIPTFSISSATGEAAWGNEYPPGAVTSLSGRNFTLGFRDSLPLVALNASAGDPFSW